MADNESAARQWWQTGVIYQIYPRSFQDTDGDGVGDLRGITARLDYLAGMGVDAIWISPFYPSPMADFGYDVADYKGVDPLFGTLADFDDLLKAAHSKGLRVILDFVPNHSSDVHPWFLDSRSSRDNPRRDWYLWRNAALAGDDWQPARLRLPNNWMSHFGGSAWEWDEHTEQFYLHSFLKQQPDLNWRNPKVRAAIYSAMQFWLDRGVDGFRMDVLWLLIKDAHFRNNPPNPDYHGDMHDFAATLPVYTSDQPETHEIVAEMRTILDGYPDTLAGGQGTGNREQGTAGGSSSSPATSSSASPLSLSSVSPSFLSSFAAGGGSASAPAHSSGQLAGGLSNRVLIGEIYLPLPELVRYYGMPEAAAAGLQPQLRGANLPFNFQLILTPWKAEAIAEVIRSYEQLLPPGAWPNYVLGNHDQPRLASRIGAKQARVAAMLLLTLRGTPTLYYGDELGMEDVPIAPDQVRDPAEKNEPGKGRGRDPERSPMLWLNSPNAGFTAPDATPWLPLQADWPARNAAAQRQDKRSMLTLYRKLLHLRRQHDTLHAGGLADVAAEGSLLRYLRTGLSEGHSSDFLVLLNLGSEPVTTNSPAGTVVLTTLLDGEGADVSGEVTVEGGEGILVALDSRE